MAIENRSLRYAAAAVTGSFVLAAAISLMWLLGELLGEFVYWGWPSLVPTETGLPTGFQRVLLGGTAIAAVCLGRTLVRPAIEVVFLMLVELGVEVLRKLGVTISLD
jgi:hypothetical protein